MSERRYNPIIGVARESAKAEETVLVDMLCGWSETAKTLEKTGDNLTFEKLRRTFADTDELLRDLEGRNQYLETNWCPIATKRLRDLAVETGIALSTIARAASGRLHRYDIKPEIIAEYKKWRNVYELTRRLKDNGRSKEFSRPK